MMKQWAFHGHVADPFSEFPIREHGPPEVHTSAGKGRLTEFDYWQEGFKCSPDPAQVPSFLRQLLTPLYVAGRTLNTLKRSGFPAYYQFCDTLPEHELLLADTHDALRRVAQATEALAGTQAAAIAALNTVLEHERAVAAGEAYAGPKGESVADVVRRLELEGDRRREEDQQAVHSKQQREIEGWQEQAEAKTQDREASEAAVSALESKEEHLLSPGSLPVAGSAIPGLSHLTPEKLAELTLEARNQLVGEYADKGEALERKRRRAEWRVERRMLHGKRLAIMALPLARKILTAPAEAPISPAPQGGAAEGAAGSWEGLEGLGGEQGAVERVERVRQSPGGTSTMGALLGGPAPGDHAIREGETAGEETAQDEAGTDEAGGEAEEEDEEVVIAPKRRAPLPPPPVEIESQPVGGEPAASVLEESHAPDAALASNQEEELSPTKGWGRVKERLRASPPLPPGTREGPEQEPPEESPEEAVEAEAEAAGWLAAQASWDAGRIRQNAQALSSPSQESLLAIEASFSGVRVSQSPGGKSQVMLGGDGEGVPDWETSGIGGERTPAPAVREPSSLVAAGSAGMLSPGGSQVSGGFKVSQEPGGNSSIRSLMQHGATPSRASYQPRYGKKQTTWGAYIQQEAMGEWSESYQASLEADLVEGNRIEAHRMGTKTEDSSLIHGAVDTTARSRPLLQLVVDRCIVQPVLAQSSIVNKAGLQLVLDKCRLVEHLQAIRSYLLLLDIYNHSISSIQSINQ